MSKKSWKGSILYLPGNTGDPCFLWKDKKNTIGPKGTWNITAVYPGFFNRQDSRVGSSKPAHHCFSQKENDEKDREQDHPGTARILAKAWVDLTIKTRNPTIRSLKMNTKEDRLMSFWLQFQKGSYQLVFLYPCHTMITDFNKKEFVHIQYLGETPSRPGNISPIIQVGYLVLYNHVDIESRFVIEDTHERIFHQFQLNDVHHKSIDELFRILIDSWPLDRWIDGIIPAKPIFLNIWARQSYYQTIFGSRSKLFQPPFLPFWIRCRFAYLSPSILFIGWTCPFNLKVSCMITWYYLKWYHSKKSPIIKGLFPL